MFSVDFRPKSDYNMQQSDFGQKPIRVKFMDNQHLHEILIRYNRIFKDTDKIYHNFAKSCGLSDCAFWILYLLRETDTQYTQADICNMLYMPRQTVNSALKNLQKDGYICLTQAQNNKKSKILVLTENGEELAKNSADIVLKAELKTLQQFSESELEVFLSLSEKYAVLLRKEYEEISDQNFKTGKEQK